ncbi:hypothetical protein Tco_1239879, partial [Tanacetum coccineum]
MVSSHPVFPPLTGCDRLVSEPRMSTLVFVDPESSTQADGAQSSRVPVPLPEDPYEAIRQAYLDGTDTESEPFEDPTDTETPDMAEVAAMSESALRKRFRSSCESSPSVSPPDLPLRKRYRGTSELVEGSEEDDDEEDEEIEESIDSDSVSEDAEDEGPTVKDEDYDLDDETHGRDDEGRGIDDEGHSVESDGLGLKEEEAIPGGQRQEAPVVGTTMSAPLGLGYGALRRRELALEEDYVYSTFKVGHGSGSALESERPERVSAFRHPSLTTWIDPKDGMVYLPTTTTYSDTTFTRVDVWFTSHFSITFYYTFTSGSSSLDAGGLIHNHVVRLEELSPALFE